MQTPPPSTPTRAARRPAWPIAPALIVVVLGALYLRTLAPGVTWANEAADSGDLIAAAATLGVAHPSGYPAYLLLARLFMLLPIGDLAFRAGLLSVAAGLGAALGVYAAVRALAAVPGWRGEVASAGAALICGLAPMLWSQAVVAEVYALNAMFVALLLWFIAEPARTRRALAARGLVAGLALGNHLTSGLVVAAWLVAALARAPGGLAPRGARTARAALALAGLAAGLLVYLYVPLRAAARPPISWGDPRDLAGFWWLVSGALYRPLAFGVPAAELPAHLLASLGRLAGDLGAPGVALALLGLVAAPPPARPLAWAGLALAAGYVLFASGYDTGDAYLYMIPASLIGAVLAGLGIAAALGRLPGGPPAGLAASAALAAALAWGAAATYPRVDASADRRAVDFAGHVLGVAPRGAIVAAESDFDAFPLWYEHYALGRRPDLFVLVDALLDYDWYRSNLRATYPALAVPAAPSADGSWLDALRAANPALPLCRTSAEQTPAIACEP